MAKFNESDYARNKDSKNIVYKFADGVRVEVSLEQYLKDNPNKTEQDYLVLKSISDENFLNLQRNDNKHGNKKTSLTDESLINLSNEISLEDKMVLDIDKRNALKAAYKLLDGKGLTPKQKNRFFLHFFVGKSLRELAESEGVSHVAILKSKKGAVKKLKNIFNKF